MFSPTKSGIAKLKWALMLASSLPLLWEIGRAVLDGLGANPVEALTRFLGTWALNFLLLTLSVSPLAQLLHQKWLLSFRRILGVTAFIYASLHVLGYVWLDLWFDWSAIARDIAKHPFILAGLCGFLLQIPLALTSTDNMVKKLGRHWKQLHKLVYPAIMLGVLHYFWLVKRDVTLPIIYTLIAGILLVFRLYKKVMLQK